jgi:hypothetical protein
MVAKERKGDLGLGCSFAFLGVLGGQYSLVVVDHPFDAEPQVRNMEVYEEADFEPTQFQVCEELSVVNTQKLLNNL